jgi:hypothetical protein
LCSRFPGRLKWSDCGNMSASVRGTWRVARVFIKTRIVFCWKIVNHCRHRFKYRKYIRGVTAYKYIRCHAMACTSSGYRRLGYKIYNNNTFIEIPSVLYITYMVFHYNSIPFRCSFFPGCGSSSVIEIVKVKYNRIDIKMWLVSISFIINIEILTKFYTKYMIFNYNTISCRCSFVPVLVKGLYQTACIMHFTCNAVSTYLNHIRLFLFFIRWGEEGGMIYQVHQFVLFSCWAEVTIVHSKY